jgi:eukaryotic-like serine/threonine-protein kinase
VKILFGDLAGDERMRKRFAQEAALASQLNHPNVVPVVDFGRSERGLFYLVMDYVQGTPLSDVIKAEAPFDPLRAARLARQLACGLGHAHEQGLVHRDFKPGNVILERRGEGPTVPRILDFGIAISTRETEEAPGRLTEAGFVVGTPVYIAPEQMLDHPVDRRTDLFAFGVVLYEMLAGKPPFDGSPSEIAQKNLTCPVQPIAWRSPGVAVPEELEKLVFRLMAKNPESRPASADEVCAALDAFERQVGRTRTHDLPALSERQSAEWTGDPDTYVAMPFPARTYAFVRARLARHGWRWVGAAGACLLAAGAIAYAAVDRHGPTDAARLEPPADSAALPAVRSNRPSMVPPSRPPSPVAAEVTVLERPAASSIEPSVTPLPPRPAIVRPSRPARRPARAARTQVPPAGPDADPFPYKDDPYMDGAVVQFIREYRQVGEAITRLEAARGEEAAREYRERYGRLQYAEALRVKAVRRDALAELSDLRRDVLAAIGRGSPRPPARANDGPLRPDADSMAVDHGATREPADDDQMVSASPSTPPADSRPRASRPGDAR